MTTQSPRETDDQTIARLLRQQRDAGLRLLLEKYGGRVKGFLRRKYPAVVDEHHFDEALSDAALKLAATFEPAKSTLGGWFLFLADRQTINILRRGRRGRIDTIPLGTRDVTDHRPTPQRQLHSEQCVAEVHQAMNQLSQLERAVIEADLDTGGKADAGRLARALGTTASSVYAARARARAKLLECLPPELSIPGKGRPQ